jgi:hypothetical protein
LKVPKIFRERKALAGDNIASGHGPVYFLKKQVAKLEYGFIAVNDCLEISKNIYSLGAAGCC